MWKRRLVFNAIFFIGTLLAGIGWIGELRDWPKPVADFLRFGNVAIVGHILQIAGLFGSLLTPDREEVDEDHRGS